jgi:SWI/SNF-related matrix-associated actin-dependent regulator of chromatin subfamily A3
LCQERLAALIELSKAPTVDLTPENITLLQQFISLSIDAQEDCPVSPYPRIPPLSPSPLSPSPSLRSSQYNNPTHLLLGNSSRQVCMDLLSAESARITICKHLFCQNCIETVIRTQQKCPMCRTELSSPEKCLVAPAVEGKGDDDNEEDTNSLASMGESSSKLGGLIQILEGILSPSPSIFVLPLSPSLLIQSPSISFVNYLFLYYICCIPCLFLTFSDPRKRPHDKNSRLLPIH